MKLLPSKETADAALAFLLLRIWIGVRALLTGVEKFTAKVEEARPVLDDMGMDTGAEVMVKVKQYGFDYYHALPQVFADKFANEPLMFPAIYQPFCASLGFVLIVLGLTTLLGVATRASIFLLGLLYIALTVGFILLAVDEGIAQLGLHTLMCALALYWAKYNCFTLTKKW